LGDFINGCFVLLYADDILLITLLVSVLQRLVTACEKVLLELDMSLNAGKSCCIRIGPCTNIVMVNGHQLIWVNKLHYLGIFIAGTCSFKIALDHTKHSFFWAANAIFGKVGCIASEDVLIQLLKMKCLPILMYPSEVCNLSKRDLQLLDSIINRFFTKLFNTNNMHIIDLGPLSFVFELPSVVLPKW